MSSVHLTVRAAGLLGALQGLVPHLPASQRDEDRPVGVGVARLTVAGDYLLCLAVAKDRARYVCTRALVVDVDDDGVPDVWVTRPVLADLIGVLSHADAQDVEVIVDEPNLALTVREAGVLWGGRQVTVRTDPPPLDPERADAAAMLVQASQARLVARGHVALWAKDATAMGRTAAMVGDSLSCRLGVMGGDQTVLVWGYSARRRLDANDIEEVVPGSAYLGVTMGSQDPLTLPTFVDVSCYAGDLLEPLLDAVLPDLDGENTGADVEAAFVAEIRDYLRGQDPDGPDDAGEGGDAA
ncbi:hypothetical protein [Actinomyces ruminis]|uniref:Uncharacterized protein n=1 Tax=Actinomyces ruminis TaxID=1937003 RepID=A0ABX4MAR5_9ACTO|nr:hypothetical protein [Actinomyces ruminis]PHP52573.1 hypothetical protein BW737_008805 [Actinomyces ruminis]